MLDIKLEDQHLEDNLHLNCCQPSIAQIGDVRILTIQPFFSGDYYGEVSFFRQIGSTGQWSAGGIIPAFKRRSCNVADIEEAVVDVRTLALKDTNRILAAGSSSFYTSWGCAFWDPAIDRSKLPKQRAIYTFYDPDKNCWSEAGFITAGDCGEHSDLRIACAQMAQMSDGTLVLPVYFATDTMIDYADVKWPRQAVKTVLARVQNDRLQIVDWSNPLTIDVERGFVEPSVKEFAGKWFMTIRAEDKHAYITTSPDALHWEEPQAWRWDDTGEMLDTDSTQQHFLKLRGELYLCYTRVDKSNMNVVRHRSPLFIARVDTENLTLIRSSEQIIFPLVYKDNIPNMQGNFHCLDISENQGLVVDAALYVTPEDGDTPARILTNLQTANITIG